MDDMVARFHRQQRLRRGVVKQRTSSFGNTAQMLSVFLVLLGLFAVLTAQARYDAVRTRGAVDSAQRALQAGTNPLSHPLALPDDTAQLDQLGTYVMPTRLGGLLGALFETEVGLIQAPDARIATAYGITVPVNALFVGDATEVFAGRRNLFASLGAALGRAPAGWHYAVSIALPDADTAQARARALRRLETIAEQVLVGGAPEAAVRVTLMDDDGGSAGLPARFTVTVREHSAL
jgi:hypothetical protein